MEQTMNAFHTLLLAVTAVAAMGVGAQAADVSGAGATFPYPIYAKWAQAYAAKTGFNLNYQ
jgi:phosphate transport system substrate-binding protein